MEELETYIYKRDHFREQLFLKTNRKHTVDTTATKEHLSFYDQTEYVHILQFSGLCLGLKIQNFSIYSSN